MRRRQVLQAGLGLAGAALWAGRGARAEAPIDPNTDPATAIRKVMTAFHDAPVKATALSDHLQLIQGPGGNIALWYGPEGSLMVDSGLPDRAKDVTEAAAKLCGGKPPAVLINTHWHADHAGGNAAFGKAGTKIWATANTRRRLSEDQYNEAFRVTTPASPPEALPVLATDRADIHIGDEEVHLTAVPPAHTDGDLVVHFRKADVIHTGDLFSNGLYPNIDGSSRGWLGGMVVAADRVLAMAGPKTRIIPGHGPVTDVETLKSYRTMLKTIYDRIAPLVDAGKSADEVIAAEPTREFDEACGKLFLNGPQFTRLVYGGLINHRAEVAK